MWAIILAGFCIGVINVSQSAPVYNVMVKKIDYGQLQLDVKEICKDAGYVRPKRDLSPILGHTTLLDKDSLKKTSEYSTPTESPSTMWTDETETEKTVTAVAVIAKESHHNATVAEGTESDYNETTTAVDDTTTETKYDVLVREGTTIATESRHDATEMARTRGDYDKNVTVVNATVTGGKHGTTVTEETITVTESHHEPTIVVENVKATGSDRDTTETVVEKSENDETVTTNYGTATGSDHFTNETVVTMKSDDEKVVTTKTDKATGSDDDTTKTVVTMKTDDERIVTTKNDTVNGSDHGTSVTEVTKTDHELTGTPKNDTTTKAVDDKTMTVDNSKIKSSEHYVAPKSVKQQHADSPAKQKGVQPASTHGTTMSVLGIMFTSLALAGIIIGITYMVYKRHKANSYVLPERNFPEATPLNHIS